MYKLGEPLDSLVLKIDRAKRHTRELESEHEKFLRDSAYRIDFRTDPNTRERVHYLAEVKPVPKTFSVILGDALNNLRSCLDYAIYAMVQVGQPQALKPNEIAFPICSSPSDYQDRIKRLGKGLRPEAIKAIDEVASYTGGAGEYYCHLAQLNNIDKHRLLLTICGYTGGHTMLPSQRQRVAEFHNKDVWELRDAFMAKHVFLGEVGEILLSVPEAEVEENMRFIINIAFAEPEICRGNPVIETLDEMARIILKLDFDRRRLFR